MENNWKEALENEAEKYKDSLPFENAYSKTDFKAGAEWAKEYLGREAHLLRWVKAKERVPVNWQKQYVTRYPKIQGEYKLLSHHEIILEMKAEYDIEWLEEELPQAKEDRCDAMGHYGGGYPDGKCPKCGKEWDLAKESDLVVSETLESEMKELDEEFGVDRQDANTHPEVYGEYRARQNQIAEKYNVAKNKGGELQSDAVELLREAQKQIEVFILKTPTGEERNNLTELNIKILHQLFKTSKP